MGVLRTIPGLAAARYGINILEVEPVGVVEGVGSGVVAVVGEFPWGPVDEATAVSGASLLEQFCPPEFKVTDNYPAMKAFLNKRFPSVVRIVRVDAASLASATATFDDGADNVLDVTAKYPGVAGNLISVEVADNADTSAHSDVTVRIRPDGLTSPASYEVTYEEVVTIVGGAAVVTDPGDPFVTMALNGSAGALNPAAAAEAYLATGSDGTAVAGDYSDAIDVLADASTPWNVAFVAEPPDGLIADINTAIDSFEATNDRGIFLYCTPAGQTQAEAITAVGSLRSDRTMYMWPQVQTTNGYSSTRERVAVQANSFVAACIATAQPYRSPGGAFSARLMQGIVALEAGQVASDPELELLKDSGIAAIFLSRELEGAIIRGAVTTSILNEDRRKVFVRRYRDYLAQAIAAFLVRFAEDPLDVDITNQRLGVVTDPEIGAVRQFLQAELDAGRLRRYTLDEFGGNTQTNIDLGQWIIDIRTKFVSAQEEIILRVQAGTTVVVDEEA